MVGLTTVCLADWIEPYDTACKNDSYWGVVTAVKVVGTSTFTATLGQYGYTTDRGETMYFVLTSTSLADTEKYTLWKSSQKAGGFDVLMGSYGVRGVFTTAAAVTLDSTSSTFSGTTAGADIKLNVFDQGAVVQVENQSGTTQTAYIRYWYVP